jgi:type II secretory pathway pseudopilin PulG
MGYISIVLVPMILIIAAIAIPNLLRARIVANEAAAASSVRIINTAQVTYTTSFPNAGFARDLATLGPGPTGDCTGRGTADHACLLDRALGCNGDWCATKYGYSFNVTGTDCAENGVCKGDVIVAVPLNANTGTRRFCSTPDMVIRSQSSAGMSAPPTADECQSWLPLT